jgi:hypothetical protein
MMNTCAVVTFVFPAVTKYFEDLGNCLAAQIDRRFDLIIFNDGITNITELEIAKNACIYEVSGTPFEIRFAAIQQLKELHYEDYIFIDADDTMTDNRVEILRKCLRNHQLVCNDLNLMSENGRVYNPLIWSSRLRNGFEFRADFIKDKNIVGLGNTGLKRKFLVDNDIEYQHIPKIADWFIFYQLLEKSGIYVLFTDKCQTNYRQHTQNDAGIATVNYQRLTYVKEILIDHYTALTAIGYNEFQQEIVKLKQLNINHNPENQLELRLFWWEEIKKSYEKDYN